MLHEVRNKPEIFLVHLDPLYTSYEKNSTENSVSRKTASVEMTFERDEASSMGIRPDYSIDASIEKHLDRKVRRMSSKFLSVPCFDNPVLLCLSYALFFANYV